jgi:hypothetical protein
VDAYYAKAATFLSSFVKDVATLSDAGELTEMMTAAWELTEHMKATGKQLGA